MIGQRWKHSNVLASRLVLIGRHYTKPQKRNQNGCLQPLYESHSTHTPQHTTRGSGITQASDHFCGGHSSGETPGNIPNPEAKPTNADGTAPDRVWESRTPPQFNSTNPLPWSTTPREGVYYYTQNTKHKTRKRFARPTLNSTYSPTRTSHLFQTALQSKLGNTQWQTSGLTHNVALSGGLSP